MGGQRSAAPVLSGIVPPLADSFFSRIETGYGLAAGLRPGEAIVLTDTEDGRAPGAGKTQLAASFAHSMWNSHAVDLLVWVNAGNRESIVSSFAMAAGEVGADHPGELADVAARRFLDWLSRTRRPWAVVLDDVTSTADMDGLWPRGASGQVVVTTRLPQPVLAGPDRTVAGVGGFSRREGVGYLNSRLNGYPDQRLEALDLAEDLAGHPLSLCQAAAVIMESDTTSREYRARYAERYQVVARSVIEDCPPALVATWSMAVERAHQLEPAGLAWPALSLAAMLTASGIPAAVLTSAAACAYIAGRPSEADVTDQNLVRSAYDNLARLGLVSLDKASGVRTVCLHSGVQAAVRAYLPRGDVEQVVAAAAAALVEAWPAPGAGTGPLSAQLEQALRDCAASLRAFAGDLLWKPDAHPLLPRLGMSLEDALLADSAIGYWQSIASTCAHLLGPGHAQSVQARDRLAAAYEAAGRIAEAMSGFEAALSDRERNLGADNPETLIARVNLAHSYEAAGLAPAAITMYEQALGECERQLGSGHRDTMAVRASLAAAYQAAGRRGDAIRLYERALSESERALGATHRDTLAARGALAAAYQAAGQAREAVTAYQRLLADRERVSGADHPESIIARGQLANACRLAGRMKEAIPQYERVLADRERLAGAMSPDTITARGNLAFAYRSAGKVKDAIPHYERVVADRERVLGSDHRDTMTARTNLANAYQAARRFNEAIPAYERAVSDSDRMLGSGDIDTITTRCNLASAFYACGRMNDMVRVLRRALADCEQFLGPDHQLTVMVRENLESVTR